MEKPLKRKSLTYINVKTALPLPRTFKPLPKIYQTQLNTSATHLRWTTVHTFTMLPRIFIRKNVGRRATSIRCRETSLDKWFSQTDLVQFLNQLKKRWRGCKREKIECNECVHRRRDAITRGRASEIAGAVIKVLGRRANSSAVTNYGVVWDSMPRTEILEVIAGIVLRGM